MFVMFMKTQMVLFSQRRKGLLKKINRILYFTTKRFCENKIFLPENIFQN
jgi:hypothetical protein